MAPPSLTLFIQGQGVASADNLNTFPQSCDTAAQLRAFIGGYTICVYLRGFTTPGDGGGGMFYWNSTSTAADNGTTVFAPAGVSTGRWIRVPEYTITSNISSITLTTTAGVSATVNYDTTVVSTPTARWTIGKNNVAESGSNAGANYEIDAYSDAGTLLGYAFRITRSTQVTDFSSLPTVQTATLISTLPVFVGSGPSAAQGLVPTPGTVVGSPLRFLREDATWAANAAAIVPMRQTVLEGPIAADGSASFLPAGPLGTGLTLTAQNITASLNVATGSGPLIATAANGFSGNASIDTTGTATANLVWTLTDASTNYLFVTVASGALTAGATVTAPVYQYGNAPSTSAGQYTYVIKNAQMYLGNGSVANPVQVVFVGEAVTSGGQIQSTVAYAYQGYAEYNDTANLPGLSTLVTKNHNLGVTIGVQAFISAVNLNTEGGYSPGDVAEQIWCANASTILLHGLGITRNGWAFSTGPSTAFQTMSRSAGGTFFTLTAANWRYRLTAKRQW
jgi:hypothetical protein